MAVKTSRRYASCPISQISPKQSCSAVREWRQNWPASCFTRRASRQAGMESSKPSPKTSPSLPFSGVWSPAKSPQNQQELGQKKSPKIMEFLKWFVWKLLCPDHLFLITPHICLILYCLYLSRTKGSRSSDSQYEYSTDYIYFSPLEVLFYHGLG